MSAALLALLVTSTGALAALGVWAVTLHRRTGSSFGGLVVVWVALVVVSDLLRVRLVTDGPDRLTSVLLALGLVGFFVCQVVLIRLLFGSWIGPLLDVFLTGMAVVVTAWSLVLIWADPGQRGGPLELLQFAAATWLLAMAGKQAGQLPQASRARILAVYAFPTLHLIAIGLLVARSWGVVERGLLLPVALLCAGYLALALTVRHTRSVPPRVASRSDRVSRLLPYALVLTAMLVSLATAVVGGEEVIRSPAFLTMCLVIAVALSIRQILTSEANAALVDAMGERERLYRSLVEDSTDLIMIADLTGRLEYLSPACAPVLGATDSELVGRPAHEVLGVEAQDMQHAIAVAAKDGPHERLNSQITVDGRIQFLESVLSVRGETVVLNVRDVTEGAILRAQLHDMAFHDPLTGLSNRARLM